MSGPIIQHNLRITLGFSARIVEIAVISGAWCLNLDCPKSEHGNGYCQSGAHCKKNLFS